MGIVADFIAKVQAVQKTGVATEHSYRSALEALFEGLGKRRVFEFEKSHLGVLLGVP